MREVGGPVTEGDVMMEAKRREGRDGGRNRRWGGGERFEDAICYTIDFDDARRNAGSFQNLEKARKQILP